jgi:hypothetical protein
MLTKVSSYSPLANDAKIQDVALGFIRKTGSKDGRWPWITVGVLHEELAGRLELEEGELILLSGLFSNESWYAFTTRRIISQFRGVLRSIDPSHGVRYDFGNFKGYGPDKDDDSLPDVFVMPMEVATITAADGEFLQFEFQTWEASMLPIAATRYWDVKHPFIDKFMTSAELEEYKKNVALARKPRGRPVKPPKEQAQEAVRQHARGVISTAEVWGFLLSRATPATLPDFMCELTPEIHVSLREVVLAHPGKFRSAKNDALFDAFVRWYDENPGTRNAAMNE